MLNTQYLEQLASKSANHINAKFEFSKFDEANIFLITSALKQKYNLWLSVKQSDVDSYYQTIVYALFIYFYKKNISKSLNSEIRVGSKYEKGKKFTR